MKNRSISKYILTAVVFLALSGGMAWGQVRWDGGGGDNNWNTATNWSGDVVPGAGDVVSFFASGYSTSSLTINVATDVVIAGLNIPNPNYQASSFTLTLTGAGSITVNNNAATQSFYRPSDDIPAGSETSTIIFDTDVTYTGTGRIDTHSGAHITVNPGSTLTADSIISAGAGLTSVITVGGTLVVDTLDITSATTRLLNISSSGVVVATTISATASSIDNNGLLVTNSNMTGLLTGTSKAPVSGSAASSFVWTGSVDTNWTTDGNWSLTGHPNGASDIAIFNGSATVNLDAPIILGSFQNSNGSTVTLNGTDTLTAGSINNNGTLDIGTNTLSAGTVTLSGGTLNAEGTITTLNASPGSTIDGNGGLSIGSLTATGTLNTAGSITMDGSAVNISNTGTIIVDTAGLSATGTVSGTGNFSVGANSLTAATISTGTFTATSGQISAASISGGNFTVGAGAQISNTVTLSGGTFTATDANLTFVGATAGTVSMDGGTLTAAGDITSLTTTSSAAVTASAALTIGALTAADTLTTSGPITMQGSAMNIANTAGTITVDAGGILASGTVSGIGNFSVGANTLSAATISGGTFTVGTLGQITTTTALSGGTFTATGANLTFAGAAAGTVSMDGGTLTADGDITSLTILSPVAIDATGGLGIANPITGSPDITVSAGTLTLNGATNDIHSLDVAAGATLSTGNNVTFTGYLTVDPAGAFTSSAGTVAFNPPAAGTSIITGNPTFNNLSCSSQGGKTLFINDTVTVLGLLNLSGTNAGSLLTVDGSSGIIALPGAQATGDYLTVNTQSVYITGGSYTAIRSAPASTPREPVGISGWNLVAGASTTTATWIGVVDDHWDEVGNWDIGVVPTTQDVIIGTPEGADLPVAYLPVSANSITVNSQADFAGEIVTVTAGITNNGLILLTGEAPQTISAGSFTNGPASTVVYYGAAAGSATWGTSYQNLTVTNTASISASSLTVAGTLTVSDGQITNAGPLSITANQIALASGATRLSTTAGGLLTIAGQNNVSIGLGGGAGTLQLSLAELATISAAGGLRVTASGTGAIAINGVDAVATAATNLVTVAGADALSFTGTNVFTGGLTASTTLGTGISLSGAADIGCSAGMTLTLGRINAGANALTLTADTLSLTGGGGSVTGTGALTIRTRTTTRGITVNGTGGGTLELNPGNLAALTVSSFSSITIGDDLSTGTTTIAALINSSFAPLTFEGDNATVDLIRVDAAITNSLANRSITFAAPARLSANVTTSNGQIAFQQQVDVTTTTSTVSSAGASIAFAAINGETGAGTENLTINAGAGTVFLNAGIGQTTPLNALTVTSGASLTLPATTTTAGCSITVNGNITQIAATALTVGGTLDLSASGLITLNNTDNEITTLGTVSRGGAFTLNDNSGGLTVSGAVSAVTTTNNVSITVEAGPLTVNNTITATGTGSITLNAPTDTLAINSQISGAGTGSVTLTALGMTIGATTVTSGSGGITLETNSIAIDGGASISSNGGLSAASVYPIANGTQINVGTGTGGLDLNNTEINRIAASNLTIGRAAQTAGIAIAGPPAVSKTSGSLTLTTSGAITAAAGSSLGASAVGANLTMNAVSGIGSITGPSPVIIGTVGGNLSATNTSSGDLYLSTTGIGTITLGGTNPALSQFAGGNLRLDAAGPVVIGGNLGVAGPGGSVTINATGSITRSGASTITAETISLGRNGGTTAIGSLAFPVLTAATTLLSAGATTGAGVFLTNTGNVSLDADAATGAVSVTTTGTLGTGGDITAGTTVALTSSSAMTVNQTVTGPNGVSLAATGAGANLTHSAGTIGSTGTAISLTADNMALSGGTVNPGAGSVTINPYNTPRAISVGGGGSGLGLSETEINTITTTGTLTIGQTANDGAITVDGALTITGAAGPVTLRNGTGGITVSNAISKTGQLTLASTGGIAVNNAISPTGQLTLSSSDGVSGGGLITTPTLSVTALRGIDLDNVGNAVATATLTNGPAATLGDIRFIAANDPLSVTASNTFNGGNVTVTNLVGETTVGAAGLVTSGTGNANVTLSSSGAITQSGPITSSGTGYVSVNASTGGMGQSAGAIITAPGGLLVQGAGAGVNNFILDQNNAIGTLGIGLLAVNMTTQNNLQLVSNSGIRIGTVNGNSGANLNGGNLTLTSGGGGAITQTATGPINCGQLTLTSVGAITLNTSGSNTITSLGSISRQGACAIADSAGGLSINGAITGITITNAVTIATSGGALAINANVSTSGANNIQLSGAGVTQAGGGTSTVNAGSGTILLDANNGSFNLLGTLTTTSLSTAAITIQNGSNADIGTLTCPSGTLVLGGTGVNNLSGYVNQTSGTISANGLSVNAGGNVTLTATGNDFGTVSVASAADLSLDDSNGYTVSSTGVQTSGTISLVSDNGGITLSGPVQSSGAGSQITVNPFGTITLGYAATAVVNSSNGNISFDSPVLLTANADVTSGAGATGNIVFAGPVTSTPAGCTLSLTAGSADIYFRENVGNAPNDPGTITVNSAGDVNCDKLIRSTGSFLVTNSGVLTISDVDGASDTGTPDVTLGGGFTHSGTGSLSISGDIVTGAAGAATFNRPATLTGAVRVNTSAGTGAVSFANAATVDGDAAGRELIVTAGSGAVSFGSAAGAGNARIGGSMPPQSLTVTTAGSITLFGQVALDYASGNTALSLTGGNVRLCNPVAVAGGNVIITNTGYFLTEEDADISITTDGTSSFSQIATLTGSCQLAGGISTTGGGISFGNDVYLFGASGQAMTLTRGNPDIPINLGGNLHIAADGKGIFFGSCLLFTNSATGTLALYNGDVTLPATSATVQAISTTQDLVLLGSAYSVTDAATGVGNLYAYNNPYRVAGIIKPAAITLAANFPDATLFPASHSGTIANLDGREITVGGNFYANGIDLDPATDWYLKINDNDDARNGFAEVYNLRLTYCHAAPGYVSAAEDNRALTAAEEATSPGCDFTRPVILADDGSQATGAAESGTYTVYDDVIRVEFSDGTGNPKLIENSNNEIWNALANIRFNDGATAFSGAYRDAECTLATSTPTSDLSVFYLRTNQNPANASERWNTDATGTDAGDAASTDRGRGLPLPNTPAATRTTIPNIDIPKALTNVFQTLRDNHKNRIANYSTLTPTPGAVFDATTDRCAPVLVEVHTGQEAHIQDLDVLNQQPYDAHNFIEFRWSEPVTVPSIAANEVNALATSSVGDITQPGTSLDVAGLGRIATGTLVSDSRAFNSSTPTGATEHAVYREFSLAGAAPTAQAHRLRVSIAGHAISGPSLSQPYAWYWPGYISSATTPTGSVTASATTLAIADIAGNGIEEIAPSNYARATVTVNSTPAGLYGPWDVTGPAPAAFRSATDVWSDPISVYEAVPDASGGIIDRIEMHFFDNAVNYSTTTDDYAWYSRRGWYPASNPAKPILVQASAQAPEAFGGSRPEDPPASEWVTTSGGIRESSLNAALIPPLSAFRVYYNGAILSNPPTDYSTNVGSKLLAPLANQYVAGDPYFMLFWSTPGGSGKQIAGSTIKVSYNDSDNPTQGFVTDLAGNLMKHFSITCVDRTPPRITFTLAGVNRTDLYVLFSKPIDFASLADIAPGLTVNLSGTPVALSGTPEVRTANNRGFLYRLATPVTAANLVNAASTIAIAGTGVTYPDPVTGLDTETSYFIDELGNYAVVGDSHRLTDIGVGLADVLYGSDGVNEPGLLGTEGGGALRSEKFDGTGRLLDKDITIATKINLASAPGSLSLYYDVNPDAGTMPLTFNEATGSSLELWLPSVISGFNRSADQDARNLSPVQTTKDRIFRNFLIPESDAEVVPGAKVQFLLQYEGLFCARLTDENDIASLAPWSFVVAETRHQRGGVTILNNVIDSDKREKTIVQVEVPKTGTVVIQVFTLDGNIVKVLERGRKGGGTYSYYWDGTNGAGNPVARGIYFIRVVGPGMDEIRKVMVVRD
jgi:hypothetical protein